MKIYILRNAALMTNEKAYLDQEKADSEMIRLNQEHGYDVYSLQELDVTE